MSHDVLTPDLVQRYRSLDARGRELLTRFAEYFPGSTIEWKRRPTAVEERRYLLQSLFHVGDGYIELRAIRPTPKHVAREWVPIGNWDAVDVFCAKWTPTHNVYFGVASRLIPGGGKAEHCGVLRALFADVDFKQVDESAAWQKIRSFTIPADIIVQSGNGLHVYWLIDPACDLQADAALVKQHLRGVAKAVLGDLACAETAHILRLPGTLNHKYDPPREVRFA